MQLFNPLKTSGGAEDAASQRLMQRTVAFFESRGHAQMRDDYHQKRWYTEFLEANREHQLFATLLTPQGYGGPDARFDTWRNCQFNEILGFYGLQYWYTWQVSMLGVGPVWTGHNEPLKKRCAQLLQDGAIFAFGLSEKEHGADIYASDMVLTPQGGGYVANGRKYYIGNGNQARLISVFGKMADTQAYVFFAVDSQHPRYNCVKNVVHSQSYVSEFSLDNYPITAADIIATGQAAWDAALNTINFCKYNLGWASIGICTHAFYEAIHHAANRQLYGRPVTAFAHVKQLFVDGYARLMAMRAFALRASDYLRCASADDRRYLLFNPLVKMKVTTEGERVIDHLWDVIAAKGFEKDMYFEEAAVQIRALPKLEGTVHVNIALIVKFMAGYFFNHQEYPPVGRHKAPVNDNFLFNQGSTKGLGTIRFADYNRAYAGWDLPNVKVFHQQVGTLKEMLVQAPPDETQRQDSGFLLSLGELFALAVYGQLILENARLDAMQGPLVDQIFDVLVRDMSRLAADLHGRPATQPAQAALCLRLVCRPVYDAARFEGVWSEVLAHRDAYCTASL